VDNLTHSIIGLIAGESAAAIEAPGRERMHGLGADMRRRLYAGIGIVGGNLPDIDLLVSSGGLGRDKLGYLLNHRGYTHTLVGCALLAFVLYAAVEGILRWRAIRIAVRERVALAVVCACAVLLHLAMDAMNSYGVHPFWPFDDGWRYGDRLFIVEPSFWVAAAPLWFVMRGRAGRAFIAVSVVGAFALSVFSGMVLAASIALLAVALPALLLTAARLSPRWAVLLSATACVAITVCFAFAGGRAERAAEAAAASAPGSGALLDAVLTPAPANPLCWDLLLLQAGDLHYTVRHAQLSLAPALLPPDRCPRVSGAASITMPLAAGTPRVVPGVQWRGEYVMARSALGAVVANHCEAAAFLQFARAPFLVHRHDGWVIGDARYDREPGLGFAELLLGEVPLQGEAGPRGACPAVVPWERPRADLLPP
jgi:inner membrane protein